MRVPDLSKGKILLMHSSIKTSLGADKYYFEELQVPSLMQKYEADIDSVCVYDDGVVKGFIKIEGTYIARLFVEPVLQNASIGSQLLEYAIKEHNADHL